MTDNVAMFMEASIAKSTSVGYDSAFSVWERHCQSMGIDSIPADVRKFTEFVADYAVSTGSLQQTKKLAAAVAHRHRAILLESPTDHSGFAKLMTGISKKLSRPSTSRVPITTDILTRMVDEYLLSDLEDGTTKNLLHWRTIWRVFMEFFGFLRWAEVKELRTADLTFTESHLRINVRRSKTDQVGRGAQVLVQREVDKSQHMYCPVHITEEYVKRLQYNGREGYLQPRIRSLVQGEDRIQVAEGDHQVSYSTAIEQLKGCIAGLGIDSTGFGEHSGKRGGATAAANNGASRDLIRLHGRWKSPSMVDLYVDSTEESKTRISPYLSLKR